MSIQSNKKIFTILLADDDDDDVVLVEKAFKARNLEHQLIRVSDGEELIDYLTGQGIYKNKSTVRPSIILLDLNMPKKDGREALLEIKQHKQLSTIPVIIFTTSKADMDISTSYKLGVNSFITKPVAYTQLIEVVKALEQYWFKTVELPK